MSKKLLTLKEVCKKIGFSHTFIYGQIRLGKFPKQLTISNKSRWLESDIDQWIDGFILA